MSASSTSSISSLPPAAQAQAGLAPPAQTGAAGVGRRADAAPVAARVEPKTASQAESKPAAAEKKAAPASSGQNISLRFQVDDKTNDVTIFVVDHQAQKVLRTIPPGEMSTLSPGELLKLSA